MQSLSKFRISLELYANVTIWDVLFSTVVLLGLGLSAITSQTYKTALTNQQKF
ncbi:MAG: hypothetical protein JNJ65_04700 [Cyclobacteriaceae bacterium]|nr:hypothetical protein [Cyclobacteriaceae bacterium]